ncbi:uncharacterized protein LOC114423378 [Glycine soja]|uniref:Uncharacterized protein n=1 Tax=Glycine soja TaxID=3848 RepID=A0A445M5Y6_GLYSO|nr:uncharacterized protein LOC114423378 [Glycine soja]KHN42663.1 hypothetical protein glysoja_018906 [Glycine soja]RZC30979.1 hypothetical protein D0Y65_002143 [Glycine soja]RZC30980.1 hypothetical protein D0Y65_002143 [Glycine soja]
MDWTRFFKPQTPQTPQKTSAIPTLDQVMSGTKGATDAFYGVSNSFRKLGTSSIPGMAVGYGIGFSHGFGLGLSMRSGVNQLQSSLAEPMTKMIGLIPGLPFGQGALPMPTSSKSRQISAESIMQRATKSFDQISQESMMQLASKSASQISQGLVGSQPTKIDSAFDNKVLKRAAVDSASHTQTEKVMKQQQIIDELVEENEKLRQILQANNLKIP